MVGRRLGWRRVSPPLAAAVIVIGVAAPWMPAQAEIELSSWAARAEAAPVYTTFDLPGTLPFSPILNVNLAYALSEMSVSQNRAVAAPAWPGSVAAGLPGALALLGLPVPPEVLQTVAAGVSSSYAESFYPNGGTDEGPVPAAGDPSSFQVGAGRSSVETAEEGASAVANAAGVVAAGIIEISEVKSTTDTKVEGTVVRSSATTSLARVEVADVLVLESVSAVAEYASDKPEPKVSFGVGRCMIAGVPCEVGIDGVSLAGQAVSIPAAAEANAALASLEEQGVRVRLGRVVKSTGGVEVHALDIAALVPLGLAIPVGVPLPVTPPDSVAVSAKLARAVASAQAGAAELSSDVSGEGADASGGAGALSEGDALDAAALGPVDAGDSPSLSPSPSPLPDSVSAGPAPGGAPASGGDEVGRTSPIATVARVANLGPGMVLAAGLVVLAVGFGVGMVAVRRVS